MAKAPKTDDGKFAYTPDSNLTVERELTGAAAEEYAALERLWAAQEALEAAEAEEAALNQGDEA